MRSLVSRLITTCALLLVACTGDKATAPELVGSVAITSSSTTLQYGQTVQLVATVVGASGNALTGRPVTWTSSNDNVATVSPSGLVTAGAVRGGTTETVTITATSEGKSASTSIAVFPISVASVTSSLTQLSIYVGQTVQLSVSLRDVTGGTLTGRSISWTSTTPLVATITAQGLVTAVAPGTATVTATVEGKTATTTLVVSPVPVQSVSITPPTGSLYTGQTLQLAATARDSAGTALTGRPVVWRSTVPTVATINSTGLVTAVAGGTTSIIATVGDKEATAAISVLPLETVVIIRGSGQVILFNYRTRTSDTIATTQALTLQTGDSLRLTPVAAPGFLFDGMKGLVTDSVQLLSSYETRVATVKPLDVQFTPRRVGSKTLQNAYFDTTALAYRTSENFVVWWDKRWDHNFLAKDLLRQLELVRQKATTMGMTPPIGSDKVLVNAYLHHISGEDGPNIDVFDDGWGQGVGTDRFSMPFYTAPIRNGTENYRRAIAAHSPTSENPYCWCYSNPWHEGFHLMQYAAGRVNPGVFPYSGETAWYTEATADWFEKYFTLSARNASLGFGTFHGTPAFLMQPQRRLWGPPMQATWSQGVHAYAAHLLLLYVSWNGYMRDDLIPKSFFSGTSLSPQEYLYRNIPNFRDVYRKFATDMATLDGLPAWAQANISEAWTWWRKEGAKFGNALPDGRNDDNSFAFELRDVGTNGWSKPSAPLEAWAYSVTKITATSGATYRVSLRTATIGSLNTSSDLHVGLVTLVNGVRTYSTITVSMNEGSKDVVLPAGATAYVVVVSTPLTFIGPETFDYSINVQRNP